MTAEVMKVNELMEICQRVATTGLMGHKLDPRAARSVLATFQALREHAVQCEELINLMVEIRMILRGEVTRDADGQYRELNEGEAKPEHNVRVAFGIAAINTVTDPVPTEVLATIRKNVQERREIRLGAKRR